MSKTKISLKTKLLMGFLGISFLVIVTSLLSINAANTIVGLFETVVNKDFPRYTSLLIVENRTNEVINQTLILGLGETRSSLTNQSYDEQKNKILATVEEIHSNIDIYKKTTTGSQSSQEELTKFSQTTDNVIDNALQLISLREQSASSSAILSAEKELANQQQKLQREIGDIVQKELNIINAGDESVQKTVDQTIMNIYIISFIVFVLSIAASFAFSIPIANSIRRLRNAAFEVQKGNLNFRLNDKAQDELGQLSNSFDQMTQKLKEVSEQKEKNALELNKKSAELAQRMTETERINKMMLGRELKMIELKKEIEKLQERLGEKQS